MLQAWKSALGSDGSDATAQSSTRCRRSLSRRASTSVVCDLAEPASVHRAAAEIVSLHLPIAGLLNNAGIMQMCATKNALGWDMSFATNHLGSFALTEALMPSLPNGANVVFVVSAVEDPGRKPAGAGRLEKGHL